MINVHIYPPRWHFDEGMREISGFGGGYEASCRAMLLAGGTWADSHRDEALAIKSHFEVPKELDKAMCDAAEPLGGATGASFGTTLAHILYVLRHGWESWVEKMRADLREELAGGTELKGTQP